MTNTNRCVIINTESERKREVIKMLVFTVEHKYTKMIRHIEGENIAQAMKNSNTDVNYWTVIDVEER